MPDDFRGRTCGECAWPEIRECDVDNAKVHCDSAASKREWVYRNANACPAFVPRDVPEREKGTAKILVNLDTGVGLCYTCRYKDFGAKVYCKECSDAFATSNYTEAPGWRPRGEGETDDVR